MLRFRQSLLILSTILLSWLLMQAVHEFGHIAAAWISGGKVVGVLLDPLSISRTDIEPNPHPLIVVWGGPILGTVLPILAWSVMAVLRLPRGFLQFFAGFCLIANGAYIGFGSFQRIGDCGQMLRYGSPIWLLWLFGLITIPLGLWLWNGVGSYFGLRGNSLATGYRTIGITTAVLAIIVILELLFTSR